MTIKGAVRYLHEHDYAEDDIEYERAMLIVMRSALALLEVRIDADELLNSYMLRACDTPTYQFNAYGVYEILEMINYQIKEIEG